MSKSPAKPASTGGEINNVKAVVTGAPFARTTTNIFDKKKIQKEHKAMGATFHDFGGLSPTPLY